MSKLALATTQNARFEADRVFLPIDGRTLSAVYRAASQPVLVYQVVPGSMLLFLGQGEIGGVDFATGTTPAVARINAYRTFETPVSATEEARLPRVHAMLSLSDSRYEEIQGAGEIGGLAEAAPHPGTTHRPVTETIGALRAQVLRNYGFCCAVTGIGDQPHRGSANSLDLVAIRPQSAGGALHVGNLLPMVPIAARAWRRGDISACRDLNIIAVQNRLDPDLLELMDRSGRLLVPEAPLLAPDPANLAWHRDNVFCQG